MAGASIRTRYDAAKNKTYAEGCFPIDGSDVNLRVSAADSSSKGVTFKSLSLYKPGAFNVDYNLSDKDFRFQFINSFKVFKKPVNMVYSHARAYHGTALDGTIRLDSANKLSGRYEFGSGESKLKYSYTKGSTKIKPGYDFGKSAWDIAVSQKLKGGNQVKASYQSDTKDLDVDFVTASGTYGNVKVSACVNLETLKFPKLMAESTWDFSTGY